LALIHAALLALLLTGLPVAAEGPRVTVRAEAGLAPQARRLAARAERDLARIEGDLDGLPRVDRVEVRLVKHMEDVAAAAPAGRGAPVWAAGTAYPDAGVVVVAARGRRGELLDVEQTLSHELAHVALARALGPGRVPRWLTEGFAYLHSSDFSWGRAQTLMGAVMGRRLIPLGALDAAFPAAEDAAALAYAESYDFVAFLARRGRWQDERDDGSRAAFQQLLAELATGVPLEQAARDAFGRGLLDLEREWADDLRTRYLWYPIGLGATLLWVGAALLLVLGWARRRRQRRRILAQWARDEGPEPAPAAPTASTARRAP